MNRVLGSAVALALTAFAAQPVRAVPVVHTDPIAWAAALGGAATPVPFAGTSGALGNRTDLGGFDLVVQGPSFGVGGTQYPRLGPAGLLELFIVAPENPYLEFERFDGGPWRGFGGVWASTLTGNRLTMTVNGTLIAFGDYLSGAGDGFLGVVDDARPIAEVRFEVESLTDFGEYFTLRDLRVRRVSEPASAALLVLGCAVWSARRRKSRDGFRHRRWR